MRVKQNVKFSAEVTIHCYDKEQQVRKERTNNPIHPTMHSFSNRARAFDALFHGYHDGMCSLESLAKEQPLSPWVINAIIDEETREVLVPEIVDEVMGEIHK